MVESPKRWAPTRTKRGERRRPSPARGTCQAVVAAFRTGARPARESFCRGEQAFLNKDLRHLAPLVLWPGGCRSASWRRSSGRGVDVGRSYSTSRIPALFEKLEQLQQVDCRRPAMLYSWAG